MKKWFSNPLKKRESRDLYPKDTNISTYKSYKYLIPMSQIVCLLLFLAVMWSCSFKQIPIVLSTTLMCLTVGTSAYIIERGLPPSVSKNVLLCIGFLLCTFQLKILLEVNPTFIWTDFFIWLECFIMGVCSGRYLLLIWNPIKKVFKRVI